MKKLEEFVIDINEGRRPGSKNKPKEEIPGAPEFNKIDGKTPEQNGSSKESVKWALNEPINNDVIEDDDIDLNDPDNTESVEDLIDKFDAEEDFLILGRAGWGKTSIIKKLAKKYDREVITVYLDKAEATDLGGIPVPMEGNKTKAKVKNALGNLEDRDFAVQVKAMPAWAKLMLDNPDKKFLLFFDEMNQATPDVMNALMPIVLEHEICEVKFDNFFVGAAGNLREENEGGVNELSGPLNSRFKPIIKWEVGTSAAWKQTFKHLHKQWDNVLGKDFVDKFEQNADIFENPREIEHKIFKFVKELKAKGDTGRVKADKYLRRLEGLAKEDISRSQADKVLPYLADAMVACIKSSDKKEENKPKQNREKLPQEIQNLIKNGITNGVIDIDGDDNRYGISRENITPAMMSAIESDNEEVALNAEMVENYIDKCIEDGLKFKFEKDEEWKKAGFVDPLKMLKIDKNTKSVKKEEPKKQPKEKKIKED